MAKLSQQPRKPKRSHYKSVNDYERALWGYACDTKQVGVWMNYQKNKTRTTPKAKRKQRRHDALVYGMLTHGGYGKVAMYQ